MKLTVELRELTGRKAKRVKFEGFVPAVIYGPSMDSSNLKVDRKPLLATLREAGYSKLIDIKISNEKSYRKALVKEVQLNPVTRDLIHVSFYAVDMNKEIEADVPLEVTGVSPAVKNGKGVLEIVRNSIMIRCLPSDLPPKLVVDISELKEVGDHVIASALDLGQKVEFVDISAENTLISIAEPQKVILEETETEESSDTDVESSDEDKQAETKN